MIRLRSAVFIMLLGGVGAYLLGFMNGYLIAGSVISINGTQKWIDDSTAAYYDPLDRRSGDIAPLITRPRSDDEFGFSNILNILTPGSGDVNPDSENGP
jgi:hypothetical protein